MIVRKQPVSADGIHFRRIIVSVQYALLIISQAMQPSFRANVIFLWVKKQARRHISHDVILPFASGVQTLYERRFPLVKIYSFIRFVFAYLLTTTTGRYQFRFYHYRYFIYWLWAVYSIYSSLSTSQKRMAVSTRLRVTLTRSLSGTNSSGRWALRTSPGPKSTVGIFPTFTSRRISAP